jgi:hypothetical protein
MSNQKALEPIAGAGNPAGFANHQKCSSMSRRTGQPCQGLAMSNGKCRVHGGKALRGIAHPGWKGGTSGRWRDSIPISLQESYNRSMTDENILELTAEIGLVDIRIGELLQSVNTGESTSIVADVREQWKMMMSSMAREDKISYEEAVSNLQHLIFDNQEWRVWDDLFRAMKMRQSLVAQEQKRRLDIHAVINTDAAVGFVTAILQIVIDEVKDEGILRRIKQRAQEELDRRPNLKGQMAG